MTFNDRLHDYIVNHFYNDDFTNDDNDNIYVICEYLYNDIQDTARGDVVYYAKGLAGCGVFDFWYTDYYHLTEYAAAYIGFTAEDNETAGSFLTREIYNYIKKAINK